MINNINEEYFLEINKLDESIDNEEVRKRLDYLKQKYPNATIPKNKFKKRTPIITKRKL